MARIIFSSGSGVSLADLVRAGTVERTAALAAANDPFALLAFLQG